jgi:hypothetical protein
MPAVQNIPFNILANKKYDNPWEKHLKDILGSHLTFLSATFLSCTVHTGLNFPTFASATCRVETTAAQAATEPGTDMGRRFLSHVQNGWLLPACSDWGLDRVVTASPTIQSHSPSLPWFTLPLSSRTSKQFYKPCLIIPWNMALMKGQLVSFN